MTPAKWIGAVLAMVVSLGAAQAQDLSSVSTKDLISKLQDESAQTIGIHETAYLSGFIAIEDPIFDGGILGPVKPVTSPVMRELVRRGIAALPLLLDHLSDARPTKLSTNPRYFAWIQNEYYPRDPEKPPTGVNTPKYWDRIRMPARRNDHYVVKVGDFCFVAAGQIVNRQERVFLSGGGDTVEVNSPVEVPALAAAMKKDWRGLTPADHERSLEEDAIGPLAQPGQWLEAVKRLMFYYPEPGAAVAVRLLNAPLYDNQLVGYFVEDRLLKTTDESEQGRLMAQFRKKNGEANYGAMQRELVTLSTDIQDWDRARPILARAFPGVDYKHPPKSAGRDFWSTQCLVDALGAFPSEAIDQAVYDLLKRTSETHPTILQSVTERCQLVHSCAWRLTKPGERDAFEKSYDAIMSSLPKKRQSGKEPPAGKMTAFSKRFQAFLDDEIGKLAPHEESPDHHTA